MASNGHRQNILRSLSDTTVLQAKQVSRLVKQNPFLAAKPLPKIQEIALTAAKDKKAEAKDVKFDQHAGEKRKRDNDNDLTAPPIDYSKRRRPTAIAVGPKLGHSASPKAPEPDDEKVQTTADSSPVDDAGRTTPLPKFGLQRRPSTPHTPLARSGSTEIVHAGGSPNDLVYVYRRG